jgi:phosphoketolase
MIGRPVCPGAGVGFAPKSLSDLPQDFQDVQVLARCPSQQAAVDQAVTFNASMMQLDRFLDSQVPAWAFVILPLPAGRAATRKANHHD